MQVRLETLFRLTLTEREASEVLTALLAGIDESETEDAPSAALRMAAALTDGLSPAPSPPRSRRRVSPPAETTAEV